MQKLNPPPLSMAMGFITNSSRGSAWKSCAVSTLSWVCKGRATNPYCFILLGVQATGFLAQRSTHAKNIASSFIRVLYSVLSRCSGAAAADNDDEDVCSLESRTSHIAFLRYL